MYMQVFVAHCILLQRGGDGISAGISSCNLASGCRMSNSRASSFHYCPSLPAHYCSGCFVYSIFVAEPPPGLRSALYVASPKLSPRIPLETHPTPHPTANSSAACACASLFLTRAHHAADTCIPCVVIACRPSPLRHPPRPPYPSCLISIQAASQSISGAPSNDDRHSTPIHAPNLTHRPTRALSLSSPAGTQTTGLSRTPTPRPPAPTSHRTRPPS